MPDADDPNRKSSLTDWHRLFGLLLTDFFTGSPFEVELEKDLSVRHQLLDVVILRRRPGRFAGQLPDGLTDPAEHNLITFKSHHEALDDWSLKELTGHYVNYRKQLGTARSALLPEDQFRLYAVCSRFPHNLANDVTLEPVGAGVYDCRRGTDLIRVVVAGQLPETAHNAPLHLFSAAAPRVAFGASHYRQRSEHTSTVLGRLFKDYRSEGVAVSYTMQDFLRDNARELMKDFTPAERLEGLSLEERLRGLPVEELLTKLSPEERLRGLPAEQIETYLKKMRSKGYPRRRRSKRKDG